MTMMRAASYDRYGTPEVLHETIVDRPVPAAGEVLVRVHAASVNGYDVAARSGALAIMTGRRFPQRTGLDFAGEVAGAPTDDAPFKVGDAVWGVVPLHRSGSLAEFVAAHPVQLSAMPAGLDWVEAAALPVVGVTALVALRDEGRLRAGQRLLVRGASGGVGAAAIQIGRAFGAHVTGLASAASLDFVRELGADETFDYAATSPRDLGDFDVILDTVGRQARAWRRRLARGGRMIAIVPDTRRPLRSMAYFQFSRIHGTRRIRFFSAKPDTKSLSDLAGLVAQGALRPVVDATYPLSRVADAHRAMEAGGRRGKQVISLDVADG